MARIVKIIKSIAAILNPDEDVCEKIESAKLSKKCINFIDIYTY